MNVTFKWINMLAKENGDIFVLFGVGGTYINLSDFMIKNFGW